jgi:hypothetical protein
MLNLDPWTLNLKPQTQNIWIMEDTSCNLAVSNTKSYTLIRHTHPESQTISDLIIDDISCATPKTQNTQNTESSTTWPGMIYRARRPCPRHAKRSRKRAGHFATFRPSSTRCSTRCASRGGRSVSAIRIRIRISFISVWTLKR